MTEQPASPVAPVDATPPVTPPVDPPEKHPDPLRGSKASGFNAAVIGLAVVLVLLIVFIVQNTQKAEVHFLGLNGNAPVAVMLLIATAAGLFLAGVASLLRILQLRRRVKHERKARRAR